MITLKKKKTPFVGADHFDIKCWLDINVAPYPAPAPGNEIHRVAYFCTLPDNAFPAGLNHDKQTC